MIRHFNYDNDRPSLYLIPTPIGNLEDITLRALRLIKSVDYLYSEDTRVSMKLLKHYGIERQLESFHKHNEKQMENAIIGHLALGKSVGMISDAGMPLLSDPGFELVKKCLELEINVICLPGPSAGLTGLLMSGIKPHPHLFVGFLDAKNTKRQNTLAELKYREETLVFYEAPHRITELLKDILDYLGDREVVLVREISKKHEEVIRGLASELVTITETRGEYVVIVHGYQPELKEAREIDLVKAVNDMMKSGLSKTEAMKKVALLSGIPKNKIYQEYLEKTTD
ncbi:MAG: 16S rRNA (cytidine(1402)-2'-O)-methyltransferase [Candidatus Izemoplasmatales bacterium]|jgi:16S rRNA (cytidine1402-2'-O)-methyltransferase